MRSAYSAESLPHPQLCVRREPQKVVCLFLISSLPQLCKQVILNPAHNTLDQRLNQSQLHEMCWRKKSFPVCTGQEPGKILGPTALSAGHTEKEQLVAEIEWSKSKTYTELYEEALKREAALHREHHSVQKKSKQNHQQQQQQETERNLSEAKSLEWRLAGLRNTGCLLGRDDKISYWHVLCDLPSFHGAWLSGCWHGFWTSLLLFASLL